MKNDILANEQKETIRSYLMGLGVIEKCLFHETPLFTYDPYGEKDCFDLCSGAVENGDLFPDGIDEEELKAAVQAVIDETFDHCEQCEQEGGITITDSNVDRI